MKNAAMMTLCSFVTLTVVALAQAQAGTRDPLVNKRQHQQMMRIHQGVKSGALTKPEAQQLAHEQMRIRKMERHFKSDGVLTFRERARLQHSLDRASHDIYRQKHDAQTRP